MKRLRYLGTTVAVLACAIAFCGCNDPPSVAARGQYTVLLYAFSDPGGHAAEAERYKRQTEKNTHWQGLFVVSEAGHSRLCWGRYVTVEAAEKNLRRAKAYVAPAGVQVYFQALVVPLPSGQVGPPEWNLQNAPGVYSVLVAVFYDVPRDEYVGRKEFAVEYCKQLRQKGNEAYYHHGPNRSGVMVGSFPALAIRTVSRDGKEKRVIASLRMKSIMIDFQFLAVNGRKERIVLISTKQRRLPWDLKRWALDEQEARRLRKLARQGKRVVYQRPYPVGIPGKKRSDAPSANTGFGDGQSR